MDKQCNPLQEQLSSWSQVSDFDEETKIGVYKGGTGLGVVSNDMMYIVIMRKIYSMFSLVFLAYQASIKLLSSFYQPDMPLFNP